jgi:thiosulfate/3-mercaptopyruvate sulfurtransferase
MTLITALILAAGVYARPQMLVETDWLAAHLSDPDIRIVDMRFGRQGQTTPYGQGHVPNAVELENAAIRSSTPPLFVPTPAEFERLMARMGISNKTRVIVYDERGGIYAARLWWILNYYGHANVALLNGGWVKWSKEARPTSTDVPAVPPARFTASPNPTWIASADDVRAAIGKPGVKIVDARSQGEIDGKDLRGIRRGGRIPSSVPFYWEDALQADDRTFKPAAELEKLLAARGLAPSDDIITYCQVGMRASHDLFVLHLVGYDKLRNYYGAWEEWGNRDDTPIEGPNR